MTNRKYGKYRTTTKNRVKMISNIKRLGFSYFYGMKIDGKSDIFN